MAQDPRVGSLIRMLDGNYQKINNVLVTGHTIDYVLTTEGKECWITKEANGHYKELSVLE